MRAKQFFYASAGIFLRVAAYTLGATHARADYEPTTGSHVIGASFSGGFYALRSDGVNGARRLPTYGARKGIHPLGYGRVIGPWRMVQSSHSMDSPQ